MPPEKLTVVCDPADLGFETTDEIVPTETPIGQERAISVMELGLNIEQEARFNLLVSGHLGSGRNQALKSIIDRIAATKPKAAGAPLQYLAEHIAKQIQMRKRQRGGVEFYKWSIPRWEKDLARLKEEFYVGQSWWPD